MTDDDRDDGQQWWVEVGQREEYEQWLADRAAQAQFQFWLNSLEQGHDHENL